MRGQDLGMLTRNSGFCALAVVGVVMLLTKHIRHDMERSAQTQREEHERVATVHPRLQNQYAMLRQVLDAAGRAERGARDLASPGLLPGGGLTAPAVPVATPTASVEAAAPTTTAAAIALAAESPTDALGETQKICKPFGPSRNILAESHTKAKGVAALWGGSAGPTAQACAELCESLSGCTAFHFYQSGSSCYTHSEADAKLSEPLDDGRDRHAGVCTKGKLRPAPTPSPTKPPRVPLSRNATLNRLELAELNRLISNAKEAAGWPEEFDRKKGQFHGIRSHSMKKHEPYAALVASVFKADASCVDRFSLLEAQQPNLFFVPTLMQPAIDALKANDRAAYQAVGAEASKREGGAAVPPSQLKYLLEESPTVDPHLCVFRHAAVDRQGNVCASSGCLDISACRVGTKVHAGHNGGRHDMVYSISQAQGYGYFHYTMENLVRIFIGLDLLKAHPTMKVVVNEPSKGFVKSTLSMLGIPEERMVQGPLSARVVVFPEPVGCGSPTMPMMQLMRRTLWGALPPMPPPGSAKQVLVVRRRGSREVANHDDMMARLKSSAPAGVVFKEFEASGSSRDQMAQFAHSTVILAPHGAGLSNVIVARPGTAVVELNVPGSDYNACYLFMSVKLGLRYYSTVPRGASHGGKMNVDIDEVTGLVMKGLKAASGR